MKKSIIINVHRAPSHSQSLVQIQQVKNLSSMSSQLSQLFQRELQPLTYRLFCQIAMATEKIEKCKFLPNESRDFFIDFQIIQKT